MNPNRKFALSKGWQLMLDDLDIDPAHVLRRAELPGDLLVRESAVFLTPADYYRFWLGLEAEADDPTLPLRLVEALTVEAFDPPIFAAICSPDLATAIRRIARYKPLIAPLALHSHEGSLAGAETLELDIEWLEPLPPPPTVLVATELVFWVRLARLATRKSIQPLAASTPNPPEPADAYTEYLGVPIEASSRHGLTFSAEDAKRPFLTADSAMWAFFEPELRRRLSQLEASASTAERTRAALLELLPSGEASLRAVAKRLAVSTRTLQRRLGSEDETFQGVLDRTRRDLANHYLSKSELSGAEIAFLLGFEEPSSFFRAYRGWTGATPEHMRTSLRSAH